MQRIKGISRNTRRLVVIVLLASIFGVLIAPGFASYLQSQSTNQNAVYIGLFNQLNQNYASFQNWQTIANNSVNLMQNTILLMQTNLSTIFTQLSLLSYNDTNLQNQINVNLNAINNLTATLANYSYQLGVLSGTITLMQATDVNLQTQIYSINGQIATINGQITTINGQISTLIFEVNILWSWYNSIEQILTKYTLTIFENSTGYYAKFGANNTFYDNNVDFCALMNQIFSNFPYGTSILFKSGIYNVTSLINTIPAGFLLEGEYNTILQSCYSSGLLYCFRVSNNDVISGFTFANSADIGNYFEYSVYGDGSNNTIITNCNFTCGLSFYSISIYNANGVFFENNVVYGSTTMLSNSKNSSFTNNVFYTCQFGVLISGNTSIIANNLFSWCGIGISLNYMNYSAISGNTFYLCTTSGVRLSNSYYNTVQSNCFEFCTQNINDVNVYNYYNIGVYNFLHDGNTTIFTIQNSNYLRNTYYYNNWSTQVEIQFIHWYNNANSLAIDNQTTYFGYGVMIIWILNAGESFCFNSTGTSGSWQVTISDLG